MNLPSHPRSVWERSATRRCVHWLFSWRTLRRLLLTGTMLATLGVGFYSVENWRGQRAWNQYRQAMEAKGEKLDLVSLAPPAVPDDQNLAMAPLLSPLFDYSRTDQGLQWKDPVGQKRLERLCGVELGQGSPSQLPLGKLDHNTLTDLEACRQTMLSKTNLPQVAAAPTAAQGLLAALEKLAPDLEALKAAAAARPACRFPVAYDDELPAGILLPHLARLKGINATLELRAIARLELGQAPAAFSDLLLGLRLSDSLRDEPILINHLVRLATLGQSLQVIREGLARRAWTDDQLVQIESRLASLDLLAECQQAVRGERACGLGAIEWGRRQRWRFDLGQLTATSGPASVDWLALGCHLMPGGWFHQNKITLAQLHQDGTLALVDAATRRVHPEKSATVDAVCARLPNRPNTILAKVLFPQISRAPQKAGAHQTYADAARVACALERYRRAEGDLPASLDLLTPRFLERVPRDVIGGQPLRYRCGPSPGAYALYSVGWNQSDDGGTPSLTVQEHKASADAARGDWVWSLPK
jgi:hypothetical protein